MKYTCIMPIMYIKTVGLMCTRTAIVSQFSVFYFLILSVFSYGQLPELVCDAANTMNE